MITIERIHERISQLEAERAALVEQAQQQIAALNGALTALRQLLDDDAPAEEIGRQNGAVKEAELES